MIRCLTLAVIMILLNLHPAPVKGEQAYDPETDTIQMHYFESAPWYYRDKSGEFTGIGVELWNNLFALAGLKYKVTVVSFARMLEYIKTGKSYGQALFIGEEMREYGIVPQPAGHMNISVYGKKGTDHKDLESLRGKTIGFVRNSAPRSDWNQLDWFKKWPVETDEQGVKMLKLARIDALAGGEVGIRFLIRKLGYGPSDFGSSFVLVKTPWTFIISKKANVPEVTLRIQNAIAEFRRRNLSDKSVNDFFDRISSKDF